MPPSAAHRGVLRFLKSRSVPWKQPTEPKEIQSNLILITVEATSTYEISEGMSLRHCVLSVQEVLDFRRRCRVSVSLETALVEYEEMSPPLCEAEHAPLKRLRLVKQAQRRYPNRPVGFSFAELGRPAQRWFHVRVADARGRPSLLTGTTLTPPNDDRANGPRRRRIAYAALKTRWPLSSMRAITWLRWRRRRMRSAIWNTNSQINYASCLAMKAKESIRRR